jgi:hypothetical protein
MRDVKRPKHGGANESIRAGIAIVVAAALLLPATASALDPPEPLNVLFVANGYYIQETHIEDHFLDLGYAVTRRKDYQIKGTTSLAPYDLIVLTEFAPSVSSKLTAGTTPLYWSSASFNEVAVLVHRGKKVAVTGVYDTRKYTADAWKMFDLLVEQITPPRPRWQTMQDVAQAYVDSGLYSFLAQVEQDLARDPGSWTFDEVERETWLLATQWDLGEIWGHLYEHISDIFELIPQFPVFQFSVYDHPERPHGESVGFLNPDYPDEHEHWFLGQYWDAANQVALPPHWGEYHTGTDLGMSVHHFGKTIFYMGDTWFGSIPFSRKECPEPAWCDDMIVVSSDIYPDNGIAIVPVLDEDGRWVPLSIPGVHRNPGPLMAGYWPGAGDIQYTVPTGAVRVKRTFTVSLLDQTKIGFPVQTVMVWYGTATHPSELEEMDSRTRPTSWTGCSLDGMLFRACYTDSDGDVVPFSIDEEAPPPPEGGDDQPSESAGIPARFVQVAADDLNWEDMDALCWSDPDSPVCLLDDPELSPFERGGLLLYGSGRPYRKSGLFLAFVARTDIGRLDEPPPDGTGKPVAYYWNGSEWSGDEQAAVSIAHSTGTPPCDYFRFPYYCSSLDQEWWNSVFGELSARLFRSPFYNNRFVLLSNHPPYANPIQSRTASFTEPWDVTGPSPTLTSGYGPYIIDRYSSFDHYTSTAGIWHLTTVWNGNPPDQPATPYGVYSGYEEVVWP